MTGCFWPVIATGIGTLGLGAAFFVTVAVLTSDEGLLREMHRRRQDQS